MPKPRKSKTKFELAPDEEDRQVEKRRRFVVLSGLIGLAAVVVYLIVAAFPSRLFSESKTSAVASQQPVQVVVRPEVPNSPLKTAAETLFAETNARMQKLFAKLGRQYTAPTLQLFMDTIGAYQCGQYLPSAGSFYCPAEKKVYLDLAFFRALQKADSSSATLAQEYIVAHQLGHHIENLLGITAKIEAARNTLSDDDFKKLTTKQELLADYYAGVWAHYVWKRTLDNRLAETAVSDATKQSTLLAQNNETTVPDPFGYAMLGNRVNAFYRGYESGDLKAADVFDAKDLK
jgi:predicted metalloprotease